MVMMGGMVGIIGVLLEELQNLPGLLKKETRLKVLLYDDDDD